jgi:tRNA(Met) cytidine acetyltransferase
MPFVLEHCMYRLQLVGERRLLLVTGQQSDCLREARTLWRSGSLWLGDGPDDVAPQRSRQTMPWLGQEYPSVILNGFSGVHPDVLGAVGGAIQAGGLLVLLMPPLSQWGQFPDPDYVRYVALPEWADRCASFFLQRLQRMLLASPAVWHVALPEDAALGFLADQTFPLPEVPATPWGLHADASGCLSMEQHQVLAAMQECVLATQSYPLVVVADRGRGKSSGLGLAAKQLLAQGYRVAVTAPAQQSAATLLYHAGGVDDLPFYSPERLISQPVPLDLLLIDEAAAIPANLLQQLQQHYGRVVYATTVHGYEGSGQGFMLRMCRWLARHWPNWQSLTLTAPLRWSMTDPLEPLLMDVLLMNSDVPAIDPVTATVHPEQISASMLFQNEDLLRQIFGLLVLAHYQTTPTDLRLLLDAPATDIWVWRHEHVVVGVVLLTHEGPIDPDLAEAVWAGRRRPRGQLLPQTLLAHCGYLSAADYHFVRVMRIAVHPLWQQRGIGSQLVRSLAYHYREQADFLGCAFSMSYDVLQFWLNLGWKSVRVGLSRDTVTGAHAVVFLHALRSEHQSQLGEWHRHFQAQFPLWLAHSLREFPATAACQLLHHAPPVCGLTGQDRIDLRAFTEHFRSADHCWPAIHQLMSERAGVLAELPEMDACLLVERFWQGKDWSWLSVRHQLAGQKAVVTALRAAIKKLLTWPESREQHEKQ